MRFVFLAARFFPLITLGLVITFFEVGRYYRRKSSNRQWYCWGGSVLLVLTTVAWFIFRGDIHSDNWVRAFFALRS